MNFGANKPSADDDDDEIRNRLSGEVVARTEPSGSDRHAADGVQVTLPTIDDDSCAGLL